MYQNFAASEAVKYCVCALVRKVMDLRMSWLVKIVSLSFHSIFCFCLVFCQCLSEFCCQRGVVCLGESYEKSN